MHTHTSHRRDVKGGSFRCIINSVILRERPLTLLRDINCQPCMNILIFLGSVCVSAHSEQFGGFFSVCFLFGWQERLYGRVERHSLCPVFTSLEFKWSKGRSRLPFTLHHLHFPLHTVHSQLLIRPHPSTLHTNSHMYSTNIFSHAFFPHTLNTNKRYCINHSQLFTSADVHMA